MTPTEHLSSLDSALSAVLEPRLASLDITLTGLEARMSVMEERTGALTEVGRPSTVPPLQSSSGPATDGQYAWPGLHPQHQDRPDEPVWNGPLTNQLELTLLKFCHTNSNEI